MLSLFRNRLFLTTVFYAASLSKAADDCGGTLVGLQSRGSCSPPSLLLSAFPPMAQPSADSAPQKEDWVWDPAYLVSLRELWIIFAFFAIMLAWTIGVCYWLGYPADRTVRVELWWGVPKWFLIGVAAPWIFATLVSIAFAMFWMKDHAAPVEPNAGEGSK